MIYRKDTDFDVCISIEFPDQIFRVTGTYYYAPDTLYGESPNMFYQDDSELIFYSFVKVIDGIESDNFSNYLEDDSFRQEVEQLVWEQLLIKNE